MGNQQATGPDKGPFTDEEWPLIVQTFNKLRNEKKRMPREGFVRLFAVKGVDDFAASLYHVFKTAPKVEDTPDDDPGTLTFKEFFDNVSNCSRASDKSVLRTFFKVVDTDHDGKILRSEVKEFFRVAHILVLLVKGEDADTRPLNTEAYKHQLKKVDLGYGSAYSANGTDDAVDSNGTSADGGPEADVVDFDEFYAWASATVPLLYLCFSGFIYSRICPSLPIPLALSFQLPSLREKSCIIERTDQLFNLALTNASLQGSWHRLFTSEQNGLSFNRLCHYIIGYRGPNLLVLRDTNGYIFGFYTNDSWRESNSYFGTSDCFLFRLDPDFIISRPKYTSNRNFQYLNLKGYSLPHGLGVGGTLESKESFRLFVPESLEGCVGTASCPTFEYGPLSSTKMFELESIEVWAVGGEAAIEAGVSAQGRVRQVMAENIDKARKVDKAKFMENDFDKEFILGKTFGGGSKAVGVRADR